MVRLLSGYYLGIINVRFRVRVRVKVKVFMSGNPESFVILIIINSDQW